MHPRCRCAIIYDEVAAPRRIDNKPKPPKPESKPTSVINPLLIPATVPTTTAVVTPKPVPNDKPEQDNQFDFDPQRFDGQSLPEDNYNLTVRRQVQNRHIEDTREFNDYVNRLAERNLMPSKMSKDTDIQSLINEFHGKGIYTPNPKDNSPREKIDTGRIIGQYWDRKNGVFVDTTWIEIVYSKSGTHIYPNYPPKEIN